MLRGASSSRRTDQTNPSGPDGRRNAYKQHAHQLLATTHWDLDRLGPLDTAYGINESDKEAILAEFTSSPLDLVEASSSIMESLLNNRGPILPSEFGSSSQPAPEAYPAYVAEMQSVLSGFESWVNGLPPGHVTVQVLRPSCIKSNSARWRAAVEKLDGQVVCGPLEQPVGIQEVAPALALPFSRSQDRLLLHIQAWLLPDAEGELVRGDDGGPSPGVGQDWCWAVRLEVGEVGAGVPVRPSLNGNGLPFFSSKFNADPTTVVARRAS